MMVFYLKIMPTGYLFVFRAGCLKFKAAYRAGNRNDWWNFPEMIDKNWTFA